ncbi:glycosyltransferase family 2 protein, partial [Haloferax sp. Atlit-47N]|uniref:glycosyltransferase n=1 Tax=Haloferax sp. Atlit-47N TaxID=2077199 RepID=UPI000E2210FA
MYREHSIGVVVPAYNEEGLIGDVIRDMPEYVDRIFVIDDCSTDGTWDEILASARETRESPNGDNSADGVMTAT